MREVTTEQAMSATNGDSSVYVDVILPLPLENVFTYRVNTEWQDQLKLGMRVAVPFGRYKVYAGLIYRIHHTPPLHYEIKSVISVLDEVPIVSVLQFKFWEWIASYYMCTLGEVMQAAVPSAYKLNNDTRIVFNPQFDGDVSMLNEKQMEVIHALMSKESLSMGEVEKIYKTPKVFPLVKTLRDLGIVWIEEEIKQRYKPLQATYVRWAAPYRENADLQRQLFDRLQNKAYKQVEVLMVYMSLMAKTEDEWVKRGLILKTLEQGAAPLTALVKKNILEVCKRDESRLFHENSGELQPLPVLSPAQDTAYHQIQECFHQKTVCLLHGVTSSGKTEIYIHLIEQQLKQSKQVLYLLPEIALTSQIIRRLMRYFGDKVGVYHSRYNEHERLEIWNGISKKYQIIVGARSAVFLPFENLGLIIVDEEHENSFKQQDTAPRYHGRDTAVFLGFLHKAKVLLGSATPSIESYYNALQNKYGLVTLFERYNRLKMPDIWVCDMKKARQENKTKGIISEFLRLKIEKTLQDKKQVILFQNRRGFSPRVECQSCGYIPHCTNCDVTLTYHKSQNAMLCHYCGYSEPVSRICPQCGEPALKLVGFGTEKVEEEIQALFPEAKVRRMDVDTTRSKNSYIEIIRDFEDRNLDILIGTQMVTKGLDFSNVSLVGILNADGLINFPDFRAYEKSFQLMTQVSGRAGRKDDVGEVVIQTSNPEVEVIQQVMNTDYAGMYESQIESRKMFEYPPFFRLLKVSVRHEEESRAQESATVLAQGFRQFLDCRILGPESPLISRVKKYYIKEILIKLERLSPLEEIKKNIGDYIKVFLADPRFKGVKIVVDVDPC